MDGPPISIFSQLPQKRDSGPDSFFKRIQIHADQVDGLDAISLAWRTCSSLSRRCSRPLVHYGMKRLQAPFKQPGSRYSRKSQSPKGLRPFRKAGGPAGGNKLSNSLRALGKLLRAGLVRADYQCAE